MGITYQLCRGQQIAGFQHELAALRIEVFLEFPYLYDGSFEYSAVKVVTVANENVKVIVGQPYPNPTNGSFYLDIMNSSYKT